MKHIRKINEFFGGDGTDINYTDEQLHFINYLNDYIKDIFMELKDENGFNVHFDLKRDKLIIKIDRHIKNRLWNGGIYTFEFIWREIKDTIYRLLDFYYSEKPDGNIDFYNNEKSYSLKKGKFAKDYKSEEDFKKDMWIGDYTRFTNLKLIVDI